MIKGAYPEHEKLNALGGANQTVGNFIEWLADNHMMIAWNGHPNHPSWDGFWIGKGRDQLLAEFFEIDRDKLESEKCQMLDTTADRRPAMTPNTELLPCPFCGHAPIAEHGVFGHRADEDHGDCLLRHKAYPLDMLDAWNTRALTISPSEKLIEALTPSGETKAAYNGEFRFSIPESDGEGGGGESEVVVPWDTIEQIMSTIRQRAEVGGA